MDAEYTKGELYTLPNYPDTVHAKTGSRGRRICDTTSFGSKAENEANARRLVACWNACEGIPTDELEPGEYEQQIIDSGLEIGRLTAQRDYLLESLRTISRISVGTTVGRTADAAIAKATGVRG